MDLRRWRRLAYYVPLVLALAMIAAVLVATADLISSGVSLLHDWTHS